MLVYTLVYHPENALFSFGMKRVWGHMLVYALVYRLQHAPHF